MKEKLVLHDDSCGIGFFEYTRDVKNKQGTCQYAGVYIQESDSTIILRDVMMGAQCPIGEETMDNVPEDSIRVLSMMGAIFKYDLYDISQPGDTIVYRNRPWKFYIAKSVKKFFIVPHDGATYPHWNPLHDGIVFPDYVIKDDKCNTLVLRSRPYPAIYDDIWKITKEGIIPLNNDHRTYANRCLKRKK